MLAHIKELMKYRELLFALAIREIQIRYKQTLFGIGWAVIQPVAMMIIFTVIFSKFLHLPSEGIPYPIFSYSALIFWTFFSTSLSFGPDAMIRMSDTIRKIYFPREIIPLSTIFASLIDMLIAFVVFAGMMIYYKISLSPKLMLIPVLVVIQLIFTIGVVFFLSALNVHYRDIRHGIPFLAQIWMYATPIVYSMDAVPKHLRIWYVLVNPMAGLIDGYRKIILHRQLPDALYLVAALAISLIFITISYGLFKKMEGSFADVI